MLVLGRRVLPGLMVAIAATAAGAQQKACEPDEGSPNQVARAVLDLTMVQTASKPEDAATRLKDAVKLLQEGDMKKNPVGRSLVFGKTLVFWLSQPGMSSGRTTRGAIGFVTDPTAPYDIIAGIDSAFTIVEKDNPACVTVTTAFRQQKGWVDLVNDAIQLGNADKYDTAAVLARRSLQLSRSAPYGYMILAQAAVKNNQPKDAIENYKAAIEAAKDTTYAENRRQFLMQLGNYTADLAESAATPAEKTSYLAEAKAAFDALAKDPGTKFADAARAGQAHLAAVSGDTAAIKASYADQLANPGAFSYSSLMNAAVTAARTNQTKDAIKLFEAARTVNPYHRDVLYNLARLYMVDSLYDKGLPLARQLVTVDPANPDDYQLIAIAYANMKKGYDAKLKEHEAKAKAYGQRANAPGTKAAVIKANVDSVARETPIIKAYTDSSSHMVDSAIKYNTMQLPARVTFTEFTPSDAKTTIGGSVQNQTDAARTFNLKIEFIDKSGAVVATQDVSVGPVDAHQSKSFTATTPTGGVVAFRYAPIT